MKILFAADGSKYTKKALAFLATHEKLGGEDDEIVVGHVERVKGAIMGLMAEGIAHRKGASR